MDKIFDLWFESEIGAALRLAADSDLLDVEPLGRSHFLAHFSCRGLVLGESGQPVEHDRFVVGYHVADDYLRRVTDSLEVLTWLAPENSFHPNIRGRGCCIGKIAPGTPLVELLRRTHEVVTWMEVMPDENDALNPAACSWARNHPECIPVDVRPLKRRPPSFQLGEFEVSP